MKLVEEIENFQNCLIGLESTGHYAENLIYFLYERGYKIAVINPIQTDALRDSNTYSCNGFRSFKKMA